MEARLSKLEQRLDDMIPTLATRADLSDLKAAIAEGQKENRAWMLGTVLALFIGMLAVGNFLANGLKDQKPQAPSPQTGTPLIIQMPTTQPPPASSAQPAQ